MHDYSRTSARMLGTSFDLLLVCGFRGFQISVLYNRQDLHMWRDIDNIDLSNDSIQ
jgi:hypothetical protein